MSDLHERLDKLRELIQNQDFLDGKGLSNEVNIRIFCYDPADEMPVRHFIQQILSDAALNCHLIECNAYGIFIDICREIDILESISDVEESDGRDYLLEQLQSSINEKDFAAHLKERIGDTKRGDVLLLTGVGDVFPFLRVHNMLNALQPYFTDVPILVMYPGAYDGNYLKLFNQLPPSPYYRAFSVL